MKSKLMFEERDMKQFKDDRGVFMPVFQGEDQPLQAAKQINYVENPKQWTFRGLHRQFWPFGQTKMVTCLSGSLLDIAYDAYSNKVVGVAYIEKGKSVTVDPTLYHGYLTLEDNTNVLYLCDEGYKPEHEEVVSFFDGDIRSQTLDVVANKYGLIDMVPYREWHVHEKDFITKTMSNRNE